MDKKKAFEIAKGIRDFMLSKNTKRIFLKKYLPAYDDREMILFNEVPSPDGALGMFLLLKKSRFFIDKSKLNPLEKRVLEVLTFEDSLKKIREETISLRLQDKFEEFTEKILRKEFGSKVSKVNQEHMNEYDFKIENVTLCVTVEVKSDKWKYTGNISLELLRDYKRNYERNIGSILKTEATFWQVYYYDEKNDEVSSEMFLVSQLKKETYNVLSGLKQKFDLEVK